MSFFANVNSPLGFDLTSSAPKAGIACSKCKKKKGGTTLRATTPGSFQIMNMAGVFPEMPAQIGCGEDDLLEDADGEMSCASCRRKKKPDWTIEAPKIVPMEAPSAMVGSYPVINSNHNGIGMVRVGGF